MNLTLKGTVFFTVACFLITLAEGFVLHKLWGWFITPTFGGPLPNIIVCIGMGMVAATLRPTPMPDDFDAEKAITWLWHAINRLGFTFIIGGILSFFVGG